MFLMGQLTSAIKVSIPYRHSKNLDKHAQFEIREIAFQFLIGTLKTMVIYVFTGRDQHWFQFLIGTLKTDIEKKLKQLRATSFNSL